MNAARGHVPAERREVHRTCLICDKPFTTLVAGTKQVASFGVRSEETGCEKSAENQHPTLTIDETVDLLAGLICPVGGNAKPAFLFLWATNPMLLDGIRVLQACGATYVHNWIWSKEAAGTGCWGRDRHEHLLIGRRGAIAAPLPGSQPETVHRERKGGHSAKPSFYAETIERLYPGIGRFELFARGPRPGWDVGGLEAGETGDSHDGDAVHKAQPV